MTFHPRMTSRIEGISIMEDLRYRRWKTGITDLWHVSCDKNATGTYVSQAPRLVAVLECIGEGQFHIPAASDHPRNRQQEAGCLYYIPAGMELSSQISGPCQLRHLDFHLDMAQVETCFSCDLNRSAVETPRIKFCDLRIKSLVKLIADDFNHQSPENDLYGESLVSALTAALFAPQCQNEPERKRGKLAPHQLRKSIDFIEQNCDRIIRLDELAGMAGLSQSYFCSAFRESTGMPPHKWQMKARIAQAKQMLKDRDVSLASVATNVGFADQAHLTRVFRQIVGHTPGAWRKEQTL
ncbi:helix-turn-helix domain-containing protein [Thalassospira mesophila]|uniref:Transcriptional regulator n=1 Tax=Thalassospira mesophila TaxID=1293891 RepID=A0A1Y2KX17_9PROT|nr:AraC family transcriptional regulator [Thalassospira mesophila]OSQ36765.1 transcriptional regulator [Thalassospira mesophila]